jgi:site-specific recombinase XerD
VSALRQRAYEGSSTTWPKAIEWNYIRPAAERAKITKDISWHVFRHTFSTLLAENDDDVKTVQSLMRDAKSNITVNSTMNIYTHAVSSKKWRAKSKVVEMILPAEKATPVSVGVS